MMRPFIIPFLILCWVLALPGAIFAQDCDCEGSGNCPAPVPVNSTGEICFDLTDALNNDLANPDQGICGVQITFTHQHIWDLELWLVSPGGDTVQLIGPNINVFGTTNSVLWDVVFVPCSVAPIPDTVNLVALEEEWTNNQNWPFAGVITGTYHPYAGNCLESFDEGPANGEWCLLYENSPSTYSGVIQNFEVILCDQSGILCCDADAGSFSSYPDIELCEGHPDLLLDISPNYILEEPDTLEYGYTYIVSDGAGVILEYDTMPDLTSALPGTYSVCGFSYLYNDTLNIPSPNGSFTLTDLEDYLLDDTNMLCGEISTSCVDITVVAPPAPVDLQDSICMGEIYTLGNMDYTESGTYQVIFQTIAECDSIVNLDLTVLPLDTTYLQETVCENGTFTVGSTIYDQTGVFETVIPGEFGCDSLVILDLFILDPIQTDLIDTICQGESFPVGTNNFDMPGYYEVLLESELGCDSLVTLDLAVLDLQISLAAPEVITCAIPEVVLDASGSSPGNYNWSTNTGSLSGPVDEITAAATDGGMYYLTISEAGCMAIDSVEVIANNDLPIAEAGDSDTLTCVITTLQLDGTGSDTGVDYSYLWSTTDGNITSDDDVLQPMIDQPGWYYLTVTNDLTGCVGIDSVEVVNDQVYPLADAGTDGVITCAAPTFTLDGSNSFDPNFFLDWQDANGDDVFWTGELQAEVSLPGWYYLILEDPQNGCVSIDSVEVTLNQDLPVIILAEPDTINCQQEEIALDATGSDAGPGFVNEWSTMDGQISGPLDAIQTTVTAAGTYYFTLTNGNSGCISIDSLEVAIDTIPPLADAGDGADLNCGLTAHILGEPVNTSQGPNIVYQWLDGSGGAVGDDVQLIVTSGDTYIFNVLDLDNGCIASDTVFVGQDQNVPVADVGSAEVLTCDNPTDTIGGPNTSSGVFIEYEWYLDDIQLPFFDSVLEVSTPGEYCLVVSDGFNLCADTSCLTVLSDATLPLADAGPDAFLDCETGQALLDGSNSDIGLNITYTWTNNGGVILDDPQQPVINVEGVGVFYLKVRDTLNDCFTLDSALVLIDTAACMPFAAAGLPGVINCLNFPFDTLDATASSSGPNIIYNWNALSGAVINDGNTTTPVVTVGVYELVVTNTVFGLIATDTVEVVNDLSAPDAVAGPGFTLDCSNLDLDMMLDGTGSSVGPEFTYLWTTFNGSIVSGEDSLFPIINGPGIYSLEVFDNSNGCSSTDAILIQLDGGFPMPCLQDIVQIECGDFTAVVGDTCTAMNPDLIYEWTVQNGAIIGSSMEALVEVEPQLPLATVYLTVTDTTNFCSSMDSIQILPAVACFPDCAIAVPPVMTCDLTSITLDGTGSSVGPEYTYQWVALTGNLCGDETTLFPCVDAPGLYELTVTDQGTQFTCTQTVEVLEDIVPPLVDAGDGDTLNCITSFVTLNASSTPISIGDIIEWTGPEVGCVTGPTDTLITEVACDGWYFLTITSAQNGCSATDSVYVSIDTLSPNASVLPPAQLTCQVNSVLLDGSGSDQGPDIYYTWYFDGNVYDEGPDLESVNASESGIYCLEVLNQLNGCQDSICVEVTEDGSLPDVDAGPDLELTCQDTLLTITGQSMPGNQFTYLWEASNGGCITGDATQLVIETNCTGIYTLMVTDNMNGCTNQSSMEVTSNTISPLADAGPDGVLTCAITSALLDGTSSQSGPDITYSWTAISGVLSGPTDQNTATADGVGVFVLTVFNGENGCSAQDTVEVVEVLLLPIASAGPDANLTCTSTDLTLDGSLSDVSPDILYSWTAQNGGNITGGETTLFPEVDAAGMYILEVTDTLSGCSSLDTVLIGLDLESPVAQIDSTEILQLDCNTSSLQLLGDNSTPGDSLDFIWTAINGNITSDPGQPTIQVDSEGMYQLLVEFTRNGCKDSIQIAVTSDFELPSIVLADPDNLTCIDTMVQLNASGSSTGPEFEFLWSPPLGSSAVILDPISSTPTVFNPLAFSLTITNTLNGCSISDTVIVEEDTELPLAIANALGSIDCDSLEIPVSGLGSSTGPDFSYFWEGPVLLDDPENIEVTGTVSGWYHLTVTNNVNGCSSADSTFLDAFAIPIYGLLLQEDSASCYGLEDGSIIIDSVIGGAPPYLYSLDGSPYATYTQYLYLAPGSHTISVLDVNGCEWTSTTTIGAGNDLEVSLGPDIDLQLGDEVLLTAILNIPLAQVDTFWWDPVPDPDCFDCLEVVVTPEENISYSFTMVDWKGCTAADEVLLRVNSDLNIYFPNIFRPDGQGNNDLFFPQAGQDISQIRWLRIYDRWGSKVFEANNFKPNDPSFGWDGTFQGMPLNPAVFIYWTEIETIGGARQTLKGDVLLVR